MSVDDKMLVHIDTYYYFIPQNDCSFPRLFDIHGTIKYKDVTQKYSSPTHPIETLNPHSLSKPKTQTKL